MGLLQGSGGGRGEVPRNFVHHFILLALGVLYKLYYFLNKNDGFNETELCKYPF